MYPRYTRRAEAYAATPDQQRVARDSTVRPGNGRPLKKKVRHLRDLGFLSGSFPLTDPYGAAAQVVYSVTPGGRVLRVAVFMRPAAGRGLNEGEGGRIVSRVESPAAGFSKGSEILLRGGGRADLSSLGGSARERGHVMAVSFLPLRAAATITSVVQSDVAIDLSITDSNRRAALGRELERLAQLAEDQLNGLLPSDSEWQALNAGRDLSLKDLPAGSATVRTANGGEDILHTTPSVFIPEHVCPEGTKPYARVYPSDARVHPGRERWGQKFEGDYIRYDNGRENRSHGLVPVVFSGKTAVDTPDGRLTPGQRWDISNTGTKLKYDHDSEAKEYYPMAVDNYYIGNQTRHGFIRRKTCVL